MTKLLIALALAASFALSACGKKGPLEAPPPDKPEENQSQSQPGQ